MIGASRQIKFELQGKNAKTKIETKTVELELKHITTRIQNCMNDSTQQQKNNKGKKIIKEMRMETKFVYEIYRERDRELEAKDSSR